VSTVAYCAPGAELATAIAPSLAQVHVDAILPTAYVAGDTVLMVGDGAAGWAQEEDRGGLPARRSVQLDDVPL
jgi:hypothetical protein